MAACETCGNEYDGLMTIEKGGERFQFDSFECAIEKLAPRCGSCGCRVIGHGCEGEGQTFCCAHCARRAGVETLRDQAASAGA